MQLTVHPKCIMHHMCLGQMKQHNHSCKSEAQDWICPSRPASSVVLAPSAGVSNPPTMPVVPAPPAEVSDSSCETWLEVANERKESAASLDPHLSGQQLARSIPVISQYLSRQALCKVCLQGSVSFSWSSNKSSLQIKHRRHAHSLPSGFPSPSILGSGLPHTMQRRTL